MARRKRKKMSVRSSKTRKRKSVISRLLPTFTGASKIIGLFAACVLIVGGLYLAEKYVRSALALGRTTGPLKLVNPPEWLSTELTQTIYRAAGAETFVLDRKTAETVAERLYTKVPWFKALQVRTTDEAVLVHCRFRRPIALVRSGLQKFYVDTELVVLDYLPLPALSVVTVKGLPLTRPPQPGRVLERDDLAAAVQVLQLLRDMDRSIEGQKPLLEEIETIDISNFNGRQGPDSPHIVLYARDGTQIVWGAEVGMWHRHMEASDEDKLTMLYDFYQQNGTLLGSVKYIELRNPPDGAIPEPIDRY